MWNKGTKRVIARINEPNPWETQDEGTGTHGMVLALGGGETDQDLATLKMKSWIEKSRRLKQSRIYNCQGFDWIEERDSSLKPTTGCDKESDNFEENTDDSLEQHQMTDTETSSFETPLKVDKDWKEKFFYPANHVESVNQIEKLVKRTVRYADKSLVKEQESQVKSSFVEGCGSNTSKNVSEVEPKNVRKNNDALIIED
ncbi:hypothetical protein Tco_0020596 [Tanacetum coccineum]